MKAGSTEGYYHYVTNSRETTATPEIVLKQAEYYSEPTDMGHLYGAYYSFSPGLFER